MSLELETLDQLLGGQKPEQVIRSIYQSEQHFVRSLTAMLRSGEVRLIANGRQVPQHEWGRSLADHCSQAEFEITEKGASRIC